MMARNYEFIEAGGAPIKAWVNGVEFDDNTRAQVSKTSRLPFIHGVALMPDVHLGIGSTVGSVVATRGAIVPAMVGVDIGCVDAETEFLSPQGWRRISNYNDEPVMQYDPDTGMGQFVNPIRFIKEPCEQFLWFHTKYGINQMLSPEHRMLCWEIKGRDRHRERVVLHAQELANRHTALVQGAKVEFETTFTPEISTSVEFTDNQIRVHVMVSADGHIDGNAAVLRFRKERKIARCRRLLKEANISYTQNFNGLDTVFRFNPPCLVKGYRDFWHASVDQLHVIADECLHWDGNHDDRCFFTRDPYSADFIQYVFTATGTRSVMRRDENSDGVVDYRVFSHLATRIGIAGSPKTPVDIVDMPGGFKYCFQVPSGFWVMRRGGNVVMTGNCGMVALRTSLTANQMPDSLAKMRSNIEAHVPHGGGRGQSGYWSRQPRDIQDVYKRTIYPTLETICAKHDVLRNEPKHSVPQLATLGGGNHFIEVCLDEEDRVWIMLHSGSRGIGNKIGQYFIELAREDMRKWFINLEDRDLAYFPEGTDHFNDYIEAVLWAQDFARLNRNLMLEQVIKAVRNTLGFEFDVEESAVNCHHNYVEMEHHHGQNLWVTRKGAVRARTTDLGIIPGSMGVQSYIVRGKGNADSYESCSHGAGRRMARGTAKRTITLERHAEAMKGIEARLDAAVIDESPDAYKSIDDVMAAQGDLVEIVHRLHQIVNVKG